MKIKDNHNLPLDKFINFSLYNKKFGYYMKKNPFGERGDFTTSPNISRIFSEMIAVWVISFWQSLGSPKKFNFLNLVTRGYTEVPDEGILCAGVPAAFSSCLLYTSPSPRD